MKPEIVKLIRRTCERVRGGRYHVRRGLVNWTKFPFGIHPFAISIELPEDDDTRETHVTTLTLTLVTKMPDHSLEEVDDDVLEEMREDAKWIGERLQAAPLVGDNEENSEKLLIDVGFQPSLEIADAAKELQGIVREYQLEY